MKLKLTALAAALVFGLANIASASTISSPADPALAGATVVDFEDRTHGTFTSDTVGGVTLTALSGYLTYTNYTSGGIYGPTSGTELSTIGSTGFRIDFAQVVSAFGMIWGAPNVGWTISAYDSSNNLLDSYVGPSGPDWNYYVGLAAEGIAYATLTAASYDWVKIDNLAYVSGTTVSPVPVPAAGLMLVGALGALGALRRRSKRQTLA